MINVENKKVLVVGLGASGQAAAELLARKGAIVKVTEARDNEEVRNRAKLLGPCNIEFEIGSHTERFLNGIELVVTSPGVDPSALPLALAAKRDIPLVGELEVGSWFSPSEIIAITGTNGKSTVTELIGKVLSLSGRDARVCGNIGNPLSGEVSSFKKSSIAVVEVSSFQLETIKSFRPKIAVLLNVSEDHYERHKDFNTYKDAKFEIFRNQSPGDWAVLHSDFCGDPLLEKVKSRVLFFGREKGEAFVRSGSVLLKEGKSEKLIIKEEDSSIKGKHNLDNIACCALVSKIMGVEEDVIRKAVGSFKGLSHRFQRVRVLRGVEFIDDSKATNIDATKWALESVDKKVVLIAGGRDKGGDYSTILPLIKEKVKLMVLIGEAAGKIKKAFLGEVPIAMAKDMAEAVKKSFSAASSKEAVLLSPMCSSFDMFSSYKERGDVFKKEAEKLK